MRNRTLLFRRMWIIAGLMVLALAGMALWLRNAHSVHADVAPDPHSVGGAGRGAEPGVVTNVQMISETVVISVGDLPFRFFEYEEMAAGGRVVADFLMRNPGSQVESLPVGFPLYLSQRPPNVGFQEVWRLRVYINDQETPSTVTEIRGEPWAIWDMNFPPGDTSLRVTYDVPLAAPPFPAAPAAILRYILYTGAGWAGQIGQADLIVRFPYLAEETFINPKGTLQSYTVNGFDVRWHFENLEPTEADDLVLTFVQPYLWREVGRARQAVTAEPTSQNYWNLARTLASVIAEYNPSYPDSLYSFYSPLLAQIAEAQYLKAIELDPANK